MNAGKIIGIILIVAGVLGLTYGGFSYTKETHKASLGPIDLSVTEKENINIPLWASVISIIAGAGLLAVGAKKN
jgi:hypothetical protein